MSLMSDITVTTTKISKSTSVIADDNSRYRRADSLPFLVFNVDSLSCPLVPLKVPEKRKTRRGRCITPRYHEVGESLYPRQIAPR